jgi:hypothetical protein
VNSTGWQRGLTVTGGGTGVVSHVGVALIRALADNTGLTAGLSRSLADDRLLVHDRGRVLADLACVIADGGEAVSDFRLIGDQGELFGLVASVPTVWRTLSEIAAGGARTAGRLTKAVNAARRTAWAQAAVRHGGLPGVRVADKTLAGVTCIRLDASSPGPQSSFTMSASWRAGNRQPSSSQRGTTPKRLHGNTNRLALEKRDSRPLFQRRASSNRRARPSLRVQGIG